jgi:hypothetical protein
MGKEAACLCECSGASFQVKAVLEAGELILRGDLKKRIPRSSIVDVSVRDGCLCFKAGGDEIALAIGEAAALKWQQALQTPPPSLADKLGIVATTSVQLYGEIDDGNLQDALQVASRVSSHAGDIFITRIETEKDLDAVAKIATAPANFGRPLWVIFRKGAGHSLSEASIRTVLREKNLIDVKVASVSAKLTGLRFVHKK